MKVFVYKIDSYSKDLFFPKERIKSKIQIINILLEASRYILSNPHIGENNSNDEIKLVIDKMSRLFFSSKNKYYSIVFPFNLYEEGGRIYFHYLNNINVDAYLISKTKSAINCDSFNDDCVLGFADSIFESSNSLESEELWSFLKELMLFEDGYIRYDKDLEGFNVAKEKGIPDRHPLTHYDLYYTNKAAFKIGLEVDNSIDDFIDLLNIKTDCKYIKN
ncbi:hypothetical protein [Lewinella sp. LCG006]|uniref:hypothetical protein n=1 Tax=Lewinella sp. LCG006 TaxID=3231911 RepID=UPI00345FDE56